MSSRKNRPAKHGSSVSKYKVKQATNLDMAFGPKDSIYDWMPPREELGHDNSKLKYSRLVSDWFYRGLEKIEGKPKPGIDAAKAFAHIKVVISSFESKHEHKTVGAAMLLEDWFESITWRAKGEKQVTL